MITNTRGEVMYSDELLRQKLVAGYDLEDMQSVIETGEGMVDMFSDQVITPDAAEQAKLTVMSRHGAFLLEDSEISVCEVELS